jgi:hypothetical protein
LAELVAERMGGAVAGGDAAMAAESEAERKRIAASSGGCPVTHVGHYTKGLTRHRALLFKALAGPLDIPCRQGFYGLGCRIQGAGFRI